MSKLKVHIKGRLISRMKTTPINQHKSLRKYYLCKDNLNQLHLIFSFDKAADERASLNRRERVIGLFTVESYISVCFVMKVVVSE